MSLMFLYVDKKKEEVESRYQDDVQLVVACSRPSKQSCRNIGISSKVYPTPETHAEHIKIQGLLIHAILGKFPILSQQKHSGYNPGWKVAFTWV